MEITKEEYNKKCEKHKEEILKKLNESWYPIVGVNCNQKFADDYYKALKEELLNTKDIDWSYDRTTKTT